MNKFRSPWLTPVLLKSINRKNRFYKKLIKSPNKSCEQQYKTYKNKLGHLIRIAKRSYYERKFKARLEKNPVRSSGRSRVSLRASNFLSFLARWARTQASHSLTKFFITILRRKVSVRLKGNQVFRWSLTKITNLQRCFVDCVMHAHGSEVVAWHMVKIYPNQISLQDKNRHAGNKKAVFIS